MAASRASVRKYFVEQVTLLLRFTQQVLEGFSPLDGLNFALPIFTRYCDLEDFQSRERRQE
jgi:hypothetical protein